MPSHRGAVALHSRMLAEAGTSVALSDGELLERYASGRVDRAEAAFATLVERHGPMVLRACRAILRDRHAAEDAFQATFLVLARRGRSLWVRDSIAPWLHEVACRVARGARTAEGRRKALERRSADIKDIRSEDPADDLALALHEEVDRLPIRLKGAVVLCHLQGLTHEEAASRLSCPVGTVRSRLSRGRDRLRSALARQGHVGPMAVLAMPPVPGALVAASARSAARLVAGQGSMGLIASIVRLFGKGVVANMNAKSISAAAMVFITVGAAVVLGAGGGQEPKPPATPPFAVAPAPADDAEQVTLLKEKLRLLNDRVAALEAKLAGPAPETPRDSIKMAKASEIPPRKIRARFSALVETVRVKPGDVVKAGDPLVVLHGPELAAAANDARVKFVDWDRDKRLLAARAPLAKEGRITATAWTDTQSDEKKSRVQYLIALDKLGVFGMKHEQILEVLEDLQDDAPKPRKVDGTRGLVRLTITAPFAAKVVECPVDSGDWVEPKDLLITLLAQDAPAVEPVRSGSAGLPTVPGRRVVKIRPSFDNVLVEKVLVNAGQPIKKGDPMLEIRSADLAAKRNACRTKYVQWDHDHKYLVARKPLADQRKITQLVWVDTQNDERKSRLEYIVAREALLMYGMTEGQVDRMIVDLGDEIPKGRVGLDFGDLSAMTILAPADGTVGTVDVAPGNFYDHSDVWITIAPTGK